MKFKHISPGGYRFDSGLHYTVPWSTPVFALTCLLRPADVTPFTLMGEADGTVDNIYLNVVNAVSTNPGNIHFKMTIYEKYLPELYRLFPDEKKALDEFMKISNDAMIFIKVYIASRLFPQWLQKWYWKLVPKNITDVASVTAEDILPKLTKNKKLIALLSSMWIDTGARPDQASFTMTAAVFRGISMEGGCYPSRGAEEMAIELARVINSHNGTILINAPVQEILIDPCTYVVAGVKMSDNNVIAADRVVSSAGYAKTFQSLVPAQITEVLKIPKIVPGIRQSAGFVMVNIGIKATAEEIGASSSNTWHIPMDASGDSFEPMRKYFANPLEVGSDMPAFITFPSCKDKKWEASHPGRVSCQMLFMADYDWFSKYSGRIRKPSSESSDNSIVIEYNSIKDSWKSKGLEIFLKYFPAAKDRIEVVDISTPLSAEDYLSAYRGSAVGIDVTPQRFVDKDIRNLLDPVVPTIKGLFLTGQDTLICGVTLAQVL